MFIQNIKTSEKFEVVIEAVLEKDFKLIKKDPGFNNFDWNKHKGKEVYKLRLVEEEKIQGLMCLIDHINPAINAIEIELLEVRDEHRGPKKKIDRIAGCLIAFACRESIKRGHEGYLFLTPKTNLIAHYSARYYFEYTGRMAANPNGMMVADDKISLRLIKEYL